MSTLAAVEEVGATPASSSYWISRQERFWAKVEFGSGCWEWRGTRYRNGYGQARYKANGKQFNFMAHRVSYELSVGRIPDGLTIHHVCENKGCVNPAHLLPCTQKENLSYSIPASSRRTHCPQNHPYDSVEKCSGARRCSICRKEQSLRKDRKRRQVPQSLRG